MTTLLVAGSTLNNAFAGTGGDGGNGGNGKASASTTSNSVAVASGGGGGGGGGVMAAPMAGRSSARRIVFRLQQLVQ